MFKVRLDHIFDSYEERMENYSTIILFYSFNI